MLCVLFCLLTTALASPDSAYLTLLTRAALLQESTLESDAGAHALAAELSNLPDGWQPDALKLLSHAHTPPLVRSVLVTGLSTTSHVETDAILELLNASGDRQPLVARIDAVSILNARKPDEAAGPLLLTFARSRLGELPEDPDLFERSIRAAGSLTHDAIARGLSDHLLPGLVALVKNQHHNRFGILPAPSASLHKTVPIQDLQDELLRAHALHSTQLMAAMETEGGSLLQELVEAIERRLVNPDAPIETPTLTPPRLLPGHADGPALIPATESSQAAWTHPVRHGGFQLSHALVAGLFLVGMAAYLGTRRRALPLAGLSMGMGLLLTGEGILVQMDTPTRAELHPLFSFTDWQFETFKPLPHSNPPRLTTAGGPIRLQAILEHPPGWRAAALGASSVHGSNHLKNEAWPALLEESLRIAHPQTPIEVLNLGIGGTTSNGILHAGTRALAMGSRLLIVYYGHNEAAQFSNLSLYKNTDTQTLQWRIWLSHGRLYSLLSRLLLPSTSLVGTPGDIYADAVATPQQIQTLRDLALQNFKHNLNQLILRAKRHHAQVILMGVATNYRHAGVDGSSAEVQQQIADAEAAAMNNNPTAARHHWQAAIDATPHIGVVNSQIQDQPRQLAEHHGLPFMDVQQLFYARSADGLTANGLFWDDLHPSRTGHELIAAALHPVVNTMVTTWSTEQSIIP